MNQAKNDSYLAKGNDYSYYYATISYKVGLLILFLMAIISIIYNKQEDYMNPPIAKKIDSFIEIHDTKLNDQYAWMRSSTWPKKVEDQDVIEYLEQENNYFNSYIKPRQAFKDQLFEELKGRIKLADQSTYTKKDDYYYYSRTEETSDYAIFCRKKGSVDSKEEILLDVNELAKGKNYTDLGTFSMHPKHELMAYSVDYSGGEKYTIYIYDTKKQEFLSDEIPNTIGGVVWHETIAGFFYTPTTDDWRHDKVMFHKLGDDYKNDTLILHEPDTLFSVSVDKSSSREYIFIGVGGHDSNEEYIISMNDPEFKTKLIKPKQEKILYSVDHGNGYFYMHTNDEGADHFKVMRLENYSDISNADKWETYIKEDSNKHLSGFELTFNYMLLNYKSNALPLSIVKELNTGVDKEIKFPDSAFTASVYSSNYEEDDIRVSYASLSRPSTVYSYDYDSEKLSVLKTQEIPSGHNPEEYNVERIFAKSSDGVEVPISLFYKKSLFKKDGSNPLYLYGYGSYGISTPPSFRSSALSLVNRGFVYAIAHIRGGSDVDYNWYKAAKFLTKKRTFEDFIACGEHLIDQQYTSKGNIAIMGGSAGGMLMGAVINMNPELFKVAIAHVPFVDVLNTMLDETLPLTPQEFKEWGNPKDKEYFDYMLSYSPYENVSEKNYPHLFVTAGLSDPRVGYWEAAKWVAKLRDKSTSGNQILLKTNMEFGHSGASGRFDYLKEGAEDLLFILDKFDIKK